MMNTEIAIRAVQHYLYCPHRWGLLEIDRAWAENVFVTKANLMHERVHDPDKRYTLRGRKVFTSVPVYNDLEEYNLYGIIDCLEAVEDKNGIMISGLPSRYQLCIVEYKPSKPKNCDYNEDDLMQVFAQKICVDYVFGGNCDAVIYYADVKKRVTLPLEENFSEYDKKLKYILKDMREKLEEGVIPPIRKKQKCGGCSMKDLCMPVAEQKKDLKARIREIVGVDTL